MEPTQLVIIIISITIAVLFVILGIQVFYILKEVRISLQKVNKMLDDMGKVSGTVGDGVVNMAGFVNGLKAGMSAIATLRGKGGEHE
jgi:hypothetical protein